MIKVFKTKCIKTITYDKTEFNVRDIYYAYQIGSNVTVIKGTSRKGFCDMKRCMFRHGHPYGFQQYFEILDTFFVQNKKQISKIK